MVCITNVETHWRILIFCCNMQKYVQEFLFVIVHSKGWYLKYLLVRSCNQIKSIVFPFFCSMDTFQRESHGSFQLRVESSERCQRKGALALLLAGSWRGTRGSDQMVRYSDVYAYFLLPPSAKNFVPDKTGKPSCEISNLILHLNF